MTKSASCSKIMRNGRLDVVVCDDPVARYYASRKEGYKDLMKVAFLTEDVEYIGFVFSKDNAELAAQVNKGLKAIRENGKERPSATSGLANKDGEETRWPRKVFSLPNPASSQRILSTLSNPCCRLSLPAKEARPNVSVCAGCCLLEYELEYF